MSAEAVEAARVPGWEMEVLGEMPGDAHTNVLGHMDKDEHKQGYSIPDCTVIPNLTLEKATETGGGGESLQRQKPREKAGTAEGRSGRCYQTLLRVLGLGKASPGRIGSSPKGRAPMFR